MLLVIFGAGASYDSVPQLPPAAEILPAIRPPLVLNHQENDRPPLANQLFDTRPNFERAMLRFPECREIIPGLRKPDAPVERELAVLREQAKRFDRVHQELAAVLFYLHFAIWECQRFWADRHRGINNYVTLVRELERWRLEHNESICFVTFNYDTMLEEAMQQVLDINFDDFSKYVSRSDYVLIKLHGSVNWGLEVDGLEGESHSPQVLIRAAHHLKISKRYSFVKSHPMVLDDQGTVGYPALSIPVEAKDEFSCPESHVQTLTKLLPMVTKIITIGWRATEADFLRVLRDALPRGKHMLLIISGDEKGANETLRNLKREAVQPWGETIVPQYGFTGLINNLTYLDGFLSRSQQT